MASMASIATGSLTPQQRAALDALAADLRAIFGARLWSIVAYGFTAADLIENPVRSLALVERVTFDDLSRAVPLAEAWRRRGLAVPLLLSRYEFERSLDVFPLEYGSIIANHVAIVGEDPFGAARVAAADRRRACEAQAKSHLIHLRENYLETQGNARLVAQLIAASAPAFRSLLVNLASLELEGLEDEVAGGVHRDLGPATLAEVIERKIDVPAALIGEVLSSPSGLSTVADPTALLARYVDASERIWRYVDGWRT
jgi:hypothetical protein